VITVPEGWTLQTERPTDRQTDGRHTDRRHRPTVTLPRFGQSWV